MKASPAALQPCSLAALQGFAGAQVWKYEGDFTLYDLMQRKDWPYNLEPLLFGQALDGPRNAERRLASLRLVMQQARPPASPLRLARTIAAQSCAGVSSLADVTCVCAHMVASLLRKQSRDRRAEVCAASRPACSSRACTLQWPANRR
jgi:hypothetical protein